MPVPVTAPAPTTQTRSLIGGGALGRPQPASERSTDTHASTAFGLADPLIPAPRVPRLSVEGRCERAHGQEAARRTPALPPSGRAAGSKAARSIAHLCWLWT